MIRKLNLQSSSWNPEVVILVVAPFLTGLIGLTQKEDIDWDLLNYHFYTGYAFWTGSWKNDFLPAGIQSFLEPLFNMGIYFLIHTLPPIAVGFVLSFLDGFVFVAVYLLAGLFVQRGSLSRRIFLKLIIAFSGIYAPDFLSEWGGTMGDTLTGLFVLFGVYLTLIKTGNGQRSSLLTGGFLLGVGAGLKLTNGVYLLAMTVAIALTIEWTSKRFLDWILFIASGSLGLMISAGYWMLELWHRFGNPFFPFYNKLFHSPYASPTNIHDNRWFPHTMMEWIFYPFYFPPQHQLMELSVENEAFLFAYLLFIFLGIKIVMSRTQGKRASFQVEKKEKRLFLFFILSFLIWEILFSYYRYLAPLEALAPLVVFLLLRHLISDKISEVTFLGLVVFMAMNPHYPDWGRMAWGKNYFGIRMPDHFPRKGVAVVASKPIAFVIPYFPKDFQFLYLMNWGGIVSPEWKETLGRKIENASVPLFLLSYKNELHSRDQALSFTTFAWKIRTVAEQ